jgi:hypothetical protein
VYSPVGFNTGTFAVQSKYSICSPSPMLTDLEFDANNNLILGFTDRTSLQFFTLNQMPTVNTPDYLANVVSGGDILRATNSNGVLAIEPLNKAAIPNATVSEFFSGEFFSAVHNETAQGGLTYLLGKQEILTTAMDPVGYYTGGTLKLSLQTGLQSGAGYEVYAGNIPFASKGVGLSDLELVCATQPIEVGNYVWKDTDKDGVQDPCEGPLSMVALSLWKNGVQIATTTTGANGEYYFSSKSKLAIPANWTGTGADTTLLPNMAYEIRIDTTNQNQLDSLKLTTTHATVGGGNDQNDSNASILGNDAVVAFTTGAAGSTNHTFDFGFFPCPTITTPSATQTICVGMAGANITVNTNYNTTDLIKFVKFTSDQSATNGSETVTELAAIYAGTAITTVTPTGANSPYTATYAWNSADFPNATASPITYFVYAVLNPDLGAACRPVQEIEIIVNPLPTLTCTKTDETLHKVHDGTVNVSVVGSPTYTYLWSNGATTANQTGLTAATYTVTVTDSHGCTAICSSTIDTFPCTQIVMTPDPLPEGYVGVPYNVQVMATGGTAPYHFIWLPGFTGVLPEGLSMDNNGLITGTPTKVGSYLVKVYSNDGYQCPAELDPAVIKVLCTFPTTTNTVATPATCTNGVSNTNGSIAITGIADGVKYSYGTNGTTGLFALNATTLTGNAITLSNLASPATTTTYTFRIYGSDTVCYKDVTAVLDPSVCPPCSITATFTQGSCNNNGTTAITTDDYFKVTISGVSSTNGGTSGKYEVMLNGTALNTGGTAYGTDVTVGGILDFKSDGATIYNLTVRDLDQPSCVTPVFTTAASAACSTIGCKPIICLPVTVTRF